MFLRLFLISLFVQFVSAAISCLVIRPGFGLVSEDCPERAVGCRIKVDRDSIQWYEYSRLYDRNQLVCVLPGEYSQSSGCHRKKGGGSVRCWCGERDGCNDPETSRALYKAFERGGNEAVQKWHETYSIGKKEQDKENSVEIDDVVTRGVNVKSGRISAHSTTTKKSITRRRTSTTTTTTRSTTTRSYTTSPPSLPTTTKRNNNRHKVTGKVHVMNGGKIHKTPILDKKATLPPSLDEKDDRMTTKTSLITMTPRLNEYKLARRRLSEEIKEEDFRLNLILEDEEREMLLDGDEKSMEENQRRASVERARADAEKRREEAEKKAFTQIDQGDEEWDEEYEQYAEPYGFRRKHMLQRRREKERQRVAEEERLARLERQEAEERDRKAREKELERKVEKEVDDYLDGASPLGLDDPNGDLKISLFSSFLLALLALNLLQ